jgi:hypothetical protein
MLKQIAIYIIKTTLITSFFIVVFCLTPTIGQAQETLKSCTSPEILEQISGKAQLNIPLPGSLVTKVRCQSGNGAINTYNILNATPGNELSTYLRAFYVYFVWVVGILATVMVMYAGIQWLTAAGNTSRIENAKSTMNGALIGLVLTLTSYLILQLINPNLVKLQVPPVTGVVSKFTGDFCKTIDGVDYQALADKAGKDCGQVFQFHNDVTNFHVTCMSRGCSSAESCISCTNEKEPFESCKKSGLQCGFADSRVIVTGIVGQVASKKVQYVKFFRKNIKARDDPNEAYTWKEVGTIKGNDNFGLGARFVFDTKEAVPLNQFFYTVCFGNGWECTPCVAVDPNGIQEPYYFDMPYASGRASEQTHTFDFNAIYDKCTS